jgi:enoyl-[acyl-carrier protein] reductase I
MGLLEGKVGLIYGVRNERSLGWGCAASILREGGRLILSVLTEREQKDAEKLVGSVPGGGSTIIQLCDLTKDDQIAALQSTVREKVGKVDFMIHAVAFAKKEELAGRFIDASREGYALALDASAYSFVAAAKAAEPLMTDGGSMITLTYLGSEKVVPNYNTMGVAKAALESSVRYLAADLGPQKIRVNAISAGPTMTLAARGISGFTDLYRDVPERAPLRHNTTIDEVGDTAAFLVSEWSRGITGEVIYVDSGLHILAG